MNKDECCPKFDPIPWDGKIVEWNEKRFVKDKVCTLFYMPINFGMVVKRIMNKVEAVGGGCPDWLALSDHTSMWNMDLYVEVDRMIPNAINTNFTGKFISKVYEGNFKETGKWMDDFKSFAKAEGVTIGKTYMWYTTCPKCAKKYGKNYVVIIGKIE